MNLLNFVEKFPNEANCKEYSNKQGVACPKCGSMERYYESVSTIIHFLRDIMGQRNEFKETSVKKLLLIPMIRLPTST